MRIVDARTHGRLDYLTVLAFAAAPSIFGLTRTPAIVSSALAAVHLALTLITAFPAGAAKIVPLLVHGGIESVVAIALLALPWIFGFASVHAARNFFAGAGVVIFLVWLLTRYAEPAR